jgi:hypothetical protein
MLTIFRSKLWRHGAGSISGSGAGTQASQTGRGTVLWFLPSMHRVTSAAYTPRRVFGAGEGEQECQVGVGLAELEFALSGRGAQRFQAGLGRVFQILDIGGTGGSGQSRAAGRGDAEMIDTELELFAALIAVA